MFKVDEKYGPFVFQHLGKPHRVDKLYVYIHTQPTEI